MDGTDRTGGEVARLRRELDQERHARAAAERVAEAQTHRLREALSRLEAEHEELRSLVAAGTHDIKNPLTSIVGFVRLLQKEDLPDGVRTDVLGRLVTATVYTREMIDGLLDALGAGVRDGEPVPIDLVGVLTDAREDLLARHPHAEVRHDLRTTVIGHPTDIRRLFDNLLENAARHGQRERIRIAAEQVSGGSHGEVVVRVGDNGVGIAPADRERVFELFQRGGDRQAGTGSGVGLSIARRIALAAGGDLWLDEDASPLGGASFLVRLPSA